MGSKKREVDGKEFFRMEESRRWAPSQPLELDHSRGVVLNLKNDPGTDTLAERGGRRGHGAGWAVGVHGETHLVNPTTKGRAGLEPGRGWLSWH